MKYTCSKCGDSYTEKLPMTEHTVVTDPAVAASCTHSGRSEGSHCSVCGAVLISQKEVPPTEHTRVAAQTVSPSCTENGYTQYKCSVCGAQLDTVTVPATGHSFVNGSCTKCGIPDPNYLPFSHGGNYELPEDEL